MLSVVEEHQTPVKSGIRLAVLYITNLTSLQSAAYRVFFTCQNHGTLKCSPEPIHLKWPVFHCSVMEKVLYILCYEINFLRFFLIADFVNHVETLTSDTRNNRYVRL